jgi:hypothetical protein
VERSFLEFRGVEDEYPRLAEFCLALQYGEKVASTVANGTGYGKKNCPCSHSDWKEQVFWRWTSDEAAQSPVGKRNSEHFLELSDDAEVVLSLLERRNGVKLGSQTAC